MQFLLILDLGTSGGEWSASCPGRALPPGKDPRHPSDRRLGGPQRMYTVHVTYYKKGR
jgi:hypothetical protein